MAKGSMKNYATAALAAALVPSLLTKSLKRAGRPKGSKNKKPKAAGGKSNVQRMNRIMRGATGLITTSNFSARRPASKQVSAMELIVPTKVYTNNYPLYLDCSAGFQNAQVDMNLGFPTLSSLSSLLPPAASGLQQGSSRLVIKGYDKVYTMTNQTNATIEMDIYDIAMKNDVPKAQQVVTNGVYYSLNSGDPWTYWKIGSLASEGSPYTNTPTPAELLGCIPSDSPFFKDNFKVLQKKTIHMPLGAGHRHYVNLTPNWLITEGIATSTRFQGWAGHTIYCMFVIRGFPVSDNTPDPVVLTTTSSGSVAIVASERSRYCFVQDTRQSGYYQDGLTTPTDANQGLINAASGLPDTVDRA